MKKPPQKTVPFDSKAERKELQAAIRLAAKGTGWKQRQGVCFRQIEQWFIAGHLRNREVNEEIIPYVEILAKPIALDPMFWASIDLPENKNCPLSFRYWGWFVCGMPVVDAQSIPLDSAERTANAMIASLDAMLPGLLRRLETEKFSDIARNPAGNHDNWRMSTTIMYALRLEKDPAALDYVRAQMDRGNSHLIISEQFANPRIAGKSIFEINYEELTGTTLLTRKSNWVDRLLGKKNSAGKREKRS